MSDELFNDDGRADPDFEAFWRPWPKKSAKKSAREIFAKMPAAKKKAAIADAEKRHRQGWWATHPLMLAATYLRQERWDDEWQEELELERRKERNQVGLPSTPMPKPKIDRGVPMEWFESMLNRCYLDYVLVCYGTTGHALPADGGERALEEKRVVIAEMVPALLEDVAAGTMERAEAAVEIADNFLARLDLAFGLMLRDRVWIYAKKRASQQRWKAAA